MKSKKMIIAVFIILSFLFTNCTKQKTVKILPVQTLSRVVRITGITPNDLGQIMIFADDAEKNKIIFIKDFYTPGKTQKTMRNEMINYLKKLNKYNCRQSEIVYSIDSAGQKNICSITAKHR